MARTNVTSNGFFSPSRRMVSVILLPAAPRILSMASFSCSPAIEVPSIAGDAVAGLDAGRERGRAVDRRDHLDQPVFLGDLDADAAELALGGDLHVAIHLGVHVAGMGIEVGHHALDGGVDQFAVLDGAHIIGMNLRHDPLEQTNCLPVAFAAAPGVSALS